MQGLTILLIWLAQAPTAQWQAQSAEEFFSLQVTIVAQKQEFTRPVEKWLGRDLKVYDGTLTVPFSMFPWAVFPAAPQADEALITERAVFLSKAQLGTFRSGRELAFFLSHAAAHHQLGHPQRAQTLLTGERATMDMPEATKIRVREGWQSKMDEEARPVATKLYDATGCGEGKCEMFDKLLAAAK